MERIIATHLRSTSISRRYFHLLYDCKDGICYEKKSENFIHKILEIADFKITCEDNFNHYVEHLKINGVSVLPRLFVNKQNVYLTYRIDVREVYCSYNCRRKEWEELHTSVNGVKRGLHYRLNAGSTEILEYNQPEIKTRYLFIFDICSVRKAIVNKYIKDGPKGWNRNSNYVSKKYQQLLFEDGYLLIPAGGGKINLFVKFINERTCDLGSIDQDRMSFIMSILHERPEDEIIDEVINSTYPRKRIRPE